MRHTQHHSIRESAVVERCHPICKFLVQGLRPDGAGDGVAENIAKVIYRQGDAGDDGQMLMLYRRLDGSKGRLWKESSSEAEQNLTNYDTSPRIVADSSAILDD